MTTKDVADKLVHLCAKGQFLDAVEGLYSKDIVSLEPGAPPGQSREAVGIDAVRAKGKWWVDNHEVHSTTVEGPLIAGSQFVVVFKMDFTVKADGKRVTMEEIGVYKVADGKIVREEFFYAM